MPYISASLERFGTPDFSCRPRSDAVNPMGPCRAPACPPAHLHRARVRNPNTHLPCTSQPQHDASDAADTAACTSQRTSRLQPPSRRGVLAAVLPLLAAGAGAAGAAAAPPPALADPFLASTGGKGVLASEEAFLVNLRREKEGEARREIEAERVKFKREARRSQVGKLCATPFGVDVVGITELVLLVGALVGGVSARQRGAELQRLNEQLRRVNLGLRLQARAGTMYAPGLTYAPPPTSDAAAAPPPPSTQPPPPPPSQQRPPAAAAAPPRAAAAPPPPVPQQCADDEQLSAEQRACRDALRAGKRLLKERNGAAAMVRFEKALLLSKALSDRVQERRAVRGLAASTRLQGQYRAAIQHLERVLDISRAVGEYTGDADAYGSIADCYADLGEFEKAAVYYGRYIDRMNGDGVV